MPEEVSPELRAQALAAGLGIALDRFPKQIAAAAMAARIAAAGLTVPESPAAEPWPPMQPGFPA